MQPKVGGMELGKTFIQGSNLKGKCSYRIIINGKAVKEDTNGSYG